jgi:peptide deformylase
MAVRPILHLGHPLLLQVAAPVVEFDTPALHDLITDLCDTMHAAAGAGLAAPQIGVSVRVVVFGGRPSPRYPAAAAVPFTVLINPVLTPLDETCSNDWEGCLSVPGMRGVVSRYTRLRYTGYDATGTLIDRTVSDFHARVVQHECDHLDGILYPQRLHDWRQFGFIDSLPDTRSFPAA